MHPTFALVDNKRAQHSLTRCAPSFTLVSWNMLLQLCPRRVGKDTKSAAGHGGGTQCTRVAEAEGGGNSVVVEVEDGEHGEEVGWMGGSKYNAEVNCWSKFTIVPISVETLTSTILATGADHSSQPLANKIAP